MSVNRFESDRDKGQGSLAFPLISRWRGMRSYVDGVSIYRQRYFVVDFFFLFFLEILIVLSRNIEDGDF